MSALDGCLFFLTSLMSEAVQSVFPPQLLRHHPLSPKKTLSSLYSTVLSELPGKGISLLANRLLQTHTRQ